MKNNKHIKPAELAKALGVDRATIARWKNMGCPYIESKPYGIGVTSSRPLYDPEKVKSWLESQSGKEQQA